MDFGMPARERVEHLLISTSQMIRCRDEKTVLRFTLVNGEQVEGTVQWFDADTYHILKSGVDEEITLLKHSVLYYRVV